MKFSANPWYAWFASEGCRLRRVFWPKDPMCILAKGPYVYSGQSPGPYEGPTCTRCTGAKGPAWTFPNVKLQYWVVFWSERSLWYLRHCQCHWLQFWQLRSWIHDNLCYLTIKSDTGRHRQFLRCFFIMQVIFKTEESSETLPLNINWMELVYPKHWILWFGREKSMRRQFEEKKSTGHFSFFPLGLWGPLSGSPHHCWDQIRSQQATLPKNFLPLHIIHRHHHLHHKDQNAWWEYCFKNWRWLIWCVLLQSWYQIWIGS